MNVDKCIFLSAYVYSCVVYVCVDMHIGMHVCTLLYVYATHDGVLEKERTDRKRCSFFAFLPCDQHYQSPRGVLASANDLTPFLPVPTGVFTWRTTI